MRGKLRCPVSEEIDFNAFRTFFDVGGSGSDGDQSE